MKFDEETSLHSNMVSKVMRFGIGRGGGGVRRVIDSGFGLIYGSLWCCCSLFFRVFI